MAFRCPKCILLPLLLLQALAIMSFTSGFFLMRVELPFKSEAATDISCGIERDGGTCQRQGRFSKLVFIVIDALRYDFISPVESSECAELSSQPGCQFVNQVRKFVSSRPPTSRQRCSFLQMPKTAALLRNSTHARLYQFIADAPTVTMQRLKGLTSGGLPTFLDASECSRPLEPPAL